MRAEVPMRAIAVFRIFVLVVCFVASGSAQSERPSVFVGPQIRAGFADMDAGIRDSIRDVREQARLAGFRLVATEGEATLVLVVLGRGIVTNGSVGISTSSAVAGTGTGFGFVAPNDKPTLTTVLRLGEYERRMQSEGGTWTAAAKSTVEDLAAWWDANEAAVQARRR